MPEFIQTAGRDLPFVLLLIALLGFRWRVSPTASVFIRAPMETVFALVDFREGDDQRWQRTKVNCRLIDPVAQTFRLTFSTALLTGATQSSEADFRVVRRNEPRLIEVERSGLGGQSENNQLLSIRAELTPEGSGTRLRLAHVWGSRPLLAQSRRPGCADQCG